MTNDICDKWFWAYPTESVDCDGITGSAHEVYGKSEVDAVLAEKDAEIAMLKDKANYNEEGYKFKKQELSDTCRFFEEELRHQKFKRCIDKSNYWVAISYHCVDDKHRQRAEKRHYKWLELAEKFKVEA